MVEAFIAEPTQAETPPEPREAPLVADQDLGHESSLAASGRGSPRTFEPVTRAGRGSLQPRAAAAAPFAGSLRDRGRDAHCWPPPLGSRRTELPYRALALRHNSGHHR